MLSQARAAVTRRRIMDAAIELFEDGGFSGTNLNQIIRRAHVTPGAFYYHFTSKEEVALAIIDQVAQGMAQLRTDFMGAGESGLESVIEMTRKQNLVFFRFFSDFRPDPMAILRQAGKQIPSRSRCCERWQEKNC